MVNILLESKFEVKCSTLSEIRFWFCACFHDWWWLSSNRQTRREMFFSRIRFQKTLKTEEAFYNKKMLDIFNWNFLVFIPQLLLIPIIKVRKKKLVLKNLCKIIIMRLSISVFVCVKMSIRRTKHWEFGKNHFSIFFLLSNSERHWIPKRHGGSRCYARLALLRQFKSD